MAPTPRRPAPGPLTVSPANPRYFTVAGTDGPAVYLTGSHIWNNLHDGLGPGRSCVDPPERNDFPAYLDFLTAHAHNFIRLWRWENFRSQAADRVEGHPFHAANNVNDIGIASIVDYQVLPLDPRVQALQEAYLRRVVDTVH